MAALISNGDLSGPWIYVWSLKTNGSTESKCLLLVPSRSCYTEGTTARTEACLPCLAAMKKLVWTSAIDMRSKLEAAHLEHAKRCHVSVLHGHSSFFSVLHCVWAATPLGGVEWPFHRGHLRVLENTDIYFRIHSKNSVMNNNKIVLRLGGWSLQHKKLN